MVSYLVNVSVFNKILSVAIKLCKVKICESRKTTKKLLINFYLTLNYNSNALTYKDKIFPRKKEISLFLRTSDKISNIWWSPLVCTQHYNHNCLIFFSMKFSNLLCSCKVIFLLFFSFFI